MSKLILLAALSVSAGALVADGANAQVLTAGMAGAEFAAAAGVDAAACNPANLALYSQHELTLLSACGAIGNDSFSLRDYERLNGAYWDEAAKQDILDCIPDRTISLDGVSDITVGGATFGTWAFSTVTHVSSRLDLPREYVRLVLYGNTIGETFDLHDAGGGATAYTAFGLSKAFRLSALSSRSERLSQWSLGFTAKWLQGWAYAGITEAEGGIITDTEQIQGSGRVQTLTAQGGQGFAFDLGFAGPIGRGWNGGFVVRDLLGRIDWSSAVEERTHSFNISGLTLNESSDDNVDTQETVRACESSRQTLPTQLAFGVARPGRRWTTGFGFEPAGRDCEGASQPARMSAGVEWRPLGCFSPRTGLSIGGVAGRSLAVGGTLRLGGLSCDLAVHSWQTWNVFSSKGLGAGLGLRVAI